MPMKLSRGDKKTSLLAFKEKLLQELKYYDQRITETRQSLSKASRSLVEDDESSDSDTGLPQELDIGPPISQLKRQEAMLKTCMHATLELAHLEILQHQMESLTAPPKLQGEPPITEKGTWQEVVAECSVDMVPFLITFYTFRADRKFAPLLYRGLKVLPHKTSHEVELASSILHGLDTPSDAVEVIRNYAVAYRSRRSTLARLADRFGAALHMDPLTGGGYVLKCASVLEVMWSLQNKGSPIAPFHHKLKFDIDYMEEQYIKIITQAHRQLSDPSIDTDERTLLLAKIISTCLEANPPPESEPEVAVAADREVMAPPKSIPKKGKPKNKEDRVSNQKATKRPAQEENSVDTAKKSKSNENNDQNDEEMEKVDDVATKNNNEKVKSGKSAASNKKSQKNIDATKKPGKSVVQSVENELTTNEDSVATAKNDKPTTVKENAQKNAKKVHKHNIQGEKNLETEKIATATEIATKPNVENEDNLGTQKNNEIPKSARIATEKQKKIKPNQEKTKLNNQDEGNLGTEKNKEIPKSAKSATEKQKKITPNKEKTNNVASAKDNPTDTDKSKTNTANKNEGIAVKVKATSEILVKNRQSDKTATEKPVKNQKGISSQPEKTANEKSVKNQEAIKTTSEKHLKNQENNKTTSKNSVKNQDVNNAKNVTDKIVKPVKNIAKGNEEAKKVVNPSKVISKTITDNSEKVVIKNKNNTEQNTKKSDKNIASNKENTVQSVATAKNSENTAQKISTANVKKTISSINKPLNEQNPKISKPTIPIAKPTKLLPKHKDVKTGNVEKENSIINKAKYSKIPQKNINERLAKITEKTPKLIKKPIRVSPRKPLTKPKSPLVGVNMKKILQKPVTGIPRLMTKSTPRVV